MTLFQGPRPNHSSENATRFETSADQLADALQTDIGWIRQHTEYGEAERRWSAAGRPSGLLLQSPTLEVAEHVQESFEHGVWFVPLGSVQRADITTPCPP